MYHQNSLEENISSKKLLKSKIYFKENYFQLLRVHNLFECEPYENYFQLFEGAQFIRVRTLRKIIKKYIPPPLPYPFLSVCFKIYPIFFIPFFNKSKILFASKNTSSRLQTTFQYE